MIRQTSPGRREFLIGMGITAAGLSGLGNATAANALDVNMQKNQNFRFVFLPDIHLMREHRAPEGMAACLDAVGRLDPKPAFLVTGGDLIDNLRHKDLKEANALADLFVKTWHEHTKLPVYHCLGNHDPAGWGDGNIPREHPQFGFNLLKQKLDMDKLFYSFDHNGWHFVVLLNITLTTPGKYISEFSDEQMVFLKADLARHKERPTMIFAHFPAVSAIEFFDGRAKVENEEWALGIDRMTKNPMALVRAVEGANVKAVLSGHIHRRDRIDAAGLTFICSGSVSGAKWKGHDHETPEGFGIADCKEDGTFDYEYHDYNWNAES